MDNSLDKGCDIEFLAGNFEDEQEALAAWHRDMESQEMADDLALRDQDMDAMAEEMAREGEEADFQSDLLAIEEEAKWRARYKVVEGMSLNGQPLYQDTETGDICYENGKPVNSCDALAIIDGN